MNKIETELKKFLESRGDRDWLYSQELEVYVRKGLRRIPDLGKTGLHTTLDIANIQVYEEYQRQGYCRRFLDLAEKTCPFAAVFVENVLTPHLARHLVKRGYEEIRNDMSDSVFGSCYYKVIKHE